MNKDVTQDIITVGNYQVVVDREQTPHHNDWQVSKFGKVEPILKKYHGAESVKGLKVICSINHQLEGLPCVNLPDEINILDEMFSCLAAINSRESELSVGTKKIILSTLEKIKAAQSKGCYTEKQARDCINFGIAIQRNWTSDKAYRKQEIDKYIKSLNQLRQIQELILDVEPDSVKFVSVKYK